jgi:crotonobetainyl-CoA hydratase
MDFKQILVEKKGRITIITINRPEVMNCISPITSQELGRALDDFNADNEAWICIMTGAGERAFSAGNDLKWQSEHGVEALHTEGAKASGKFGGNTARFDCFKPMIAAVNGLAYGGGFEVALACDIIIAAEHATFSFPEPRVGLLPGAGGVYRLPRQIPYHMAMAMIMTSKRITAQEAKDLGLVSEVVPLNKLMETANSYAQEILKGSPIAIRAAKEAVMKGLEIPLAEAMPKIWPVMDAMHKSEDLREGALAFVQKRPPQWKNK